MSNDIHLSAAILAQTLSSTVKYDSLISFCNYNVLVARLASVSQVTDNVGRCLAAA